MLTVYAILTNAAHQDWEIEHINIKSAYLNALLKEEIYMRAPRGVLKPGQEGKVLRLVKGLYGLKQASRGLYVHRNGKSLYQRDGIQEICYRSLSFLLREHTIVVVATNDMVVTSKRQADANKFKSKIKEYWDITNHGPINWFLGFQIKRDRKSRMIS